MREERMIVVDGISRTVVISDEREALLAADAAGRASVAVWNGDREEFLPSAFAVEDPADADGEFLERVVRRKLGLPWTIRETGRLLIREFAGEDSEQVPREECLGRGDEVFADREKLYDRINRRVDQMVESGLLEEARRFLESPEEKATAMQAIGYKELAPYFADEISLEEAVESIRRETRRYAKRQLTWFRRDPEIHWIEVDRFESWEDVLGCAEQIIGQERFLTS